VGDDAFGATLRAALVGDGIIDSHVTTLPGVASGIASILVDEGPEQHRHRRRRQRFTEPAHIDAARALIEQAVSSCCSWRRWPPSCTRFNWPARWARPWC
jgi:ribokinase